MRETFPEFVRLKRRWFATLFVLNLAVGFLLVGRRYNSTLEIVGISVVVSLVATTVISLLSVPVVFLIARRRVRGRFRFESAVEESQSTVSRWTFAQR
jgi:ABC-type tungstate transport system substrate-binding protein